MTIQEFYERIGGDYNDAINRFRKDTLIQRFVQMFTKDPNFAELTEALKNDDVSTAFRNAHTLKGVAANLSFAKLQSSASEMTEYLRAKQLEDAKAYYPALEADYNLVVNALTEFQNAQ